MAATMTIQIFHGDALEFPLEVAEECDVYIGDPPYSEHVHSNATSHGTGGRGSRKRNLGFSHVSDHLREVVAAAVATVQRWGLVFCDFESAHLWRAGVGAMAAIEYIRTIPAPYVADEWPIGFELPWIRWSQPQLSGDRPPTGAECVIHFHPKGKKHWNGPGSLTHYSRRCMRGQFKHPTEKPLDLLLDLVSWYSDPGERCLDLTAGSCSLGAAALLLDRDAVCVELDEKWAEYGERRCAPDLRGLEPRDRTRAEEWCESTLTEASSVPEPKAADGSDVRTWERAQRRIADVGRVLEKLA